MFLQCLRGAIPIVPLCATAGWLPPPFVVKPNEHVHRPRASDASERSGAT
jgi:hypothetical protein